MVTPAPAVFISSAKAKTGRKEILGHIDSLLG